MELEPFEYLDKVESKETFFEFLNILFLNKREEDKIEKANPESQWFDKGPKGWVHNDIASYLDAIHAWGINNSDSEPSWKNFATLLYVGKIYE